MKPAAMIRRDIAARKPRHGAPCNNCGVCCLVTICELGQAAMAKSMMATDIESHCGPCPFLRWNGPESKCGLAELGPPIYNDAARVIIRAGEGCDCRINGEPTDTAFHAWQDRRDRERAAQIKAARKLWGLD